MSTGPASNIDHHGSQADSSDDADLAPLWQAQQLAQAFITRGATRQGLIAMAYDEMTRRSRLMLLLLATVAAVSCALSTVGVLESSIHLCCVPETCSNVSGLQGAMPGFTTRSYVCALTPAQAAAMQCSDPVGTSAALNDPVCQNLSAGGCQRAYNINAAIVPVAAGCCALAAVLCAIPLCMCTRACCGVWGLPFFFIAWGALGVLSVLAAALAGAGGGPLNAAVGLTNDGLQTNTDTNEAVRWPTQCFNGSVAIGVSSVELTPTFTRSQWGVYGAIGVLGLLLVSAPLLWYLQYRRLQHQIRARIIHSLLFGEPSDSEDD